MNHGSFARNCELLLIHLSSLQSGKAKKCKATTKYLAKSINKSIRQTNRYLKTLEDNKEIKRTTSGFFRNKINRRPYKLRTIEVFTPKPHNSKQILDLYFKKNIHGRTKNRLIRELVKSPEFKFKNRINTNKILNPHRIQDFIVKETIKEKEQQALYFNLNLIMKKNEEKSKENFMQKREEIEEIVRQSELQLKEKHFYSDLDKKADKIFQQMWDGSIKIPPWANKTPLSRLAYLSCEQFKENELLMENLDPPTYEMRKQKAEVWAQNSTKKFLSSSNEGVFEYWITIYLGGEIPYEIPLNQYLPYSFAPTSNTDYYKLFVEAFKEKKNE